MVTAALRPGTVQSLYRSGEGRPMVVMVAFLLEEMKKKKIGEEEKKNVKPEKKEGEMSLLL